MRVIKATNAPINFEIVDNIVDKLTPEAIASSKRTGCTLKGEFVTGACRSGTNEYPMRATQCVG